MPYLLTDMHPAMHIRIYMMAVSFILIPILSYKFWSIRRHFIVKGRFPIMTIIASNSMLLVATSLLLISEFEYNNIVGETDHIKSDNFWFNFIGAVGQSFSFIFCALILYRTYLVSKKWKKTQKTIHKHQATKSVGLSFRKESIVFVLSKKFEESRFKRILYKYWTILGIFVIFGVLIVLFWFREAYMVYLLQTIFLGVVVHGCLIIYRTRETKEALSCIRESYMVIFIIIGQLINSGIGSRVDFPREWRFLVSTTLSLVGSYALLCVSLIMVYINDGTLSPSKLFNVNPNPNEMDQVIDTMCLSEYLNKNRYEYDLFMKYLGDVMAVEGLLFYANVSIFIQRLVVLMEKHFPNANDTWSDNVYHELNFNYLTELHQLYADGINDDTINDDTINSIKSIGNDIRRKYIDNYSEHCINISYACRRNLILFYDETNNIDISADNYSIIIIKYICAYKSAINETYKLLKSVYNFKFKKYLKSNDK